MTLPEPTRIVGVVYDATLDSGERCVLTDDGAYVYFTAMLALADVGDGERVVVTVEKASE